MRAEEVIRFYNASEVRFRHDVLLVSVNKSSEDRDLIDAVRYCWKLVRSNAAACEYVLAVRSGLIIGAFVADKWLVATPENFPSFPPLDEERFGFVGHEAPPDVKRHYLHKRVPVAYRFKGNPIRYGPKVSNR